MQTKYPPLADHADRTFIAMMVSLSIITSHGCQHSPIKLSARGLEAGRYKGNAFVFFHQPVSGSTYQIFLIPVREKTASLRLSDIAAKKMLFTTGINFILTSDQLVNVRRDKATLYIFGPVTNGSRGIFDAG